MLNIRTLFSRWTAIPIALIASLGITGAAQAAYPDKPIHLIVSFAPGGATDVVARALAARLPIGFLIGLRRRNRKTASAVAGYD